MKRFVAGAMVAVALIIATVLIWYGLNDQARGIVVGVLLGITGLAAGIILAFAVVGVFLLINLRWSVMSKPPIIQQMPTLPSPLALPPAGTSAPAWWPRPARSWVVGEDDIEDGDFQRLG